MSHLGGREAELEHGFGKDLLWDLISGLILSILMRDGGELHVTRRDKSSGLSLEVRKGLRRADIVRLCFWVFSFQHQNRIEGLPAGLAKS